MSTAAKSKSWNGAILDQHPRISNKTRSNRGHGYSLSLSSSPSQWVNKFSRAKGLLWYYYVLDVFLSFSIYLYVFPRFPCWKQQLSISFKFLASKYHLQYRTPILNTQWNQTFGIASSHDLGAGSYSWLIWMVVHIEAPYPPSYWAYHHCLPWGKQRCMCKTHGFPWFRVRKMNYKWCLLQLQHIYVSGIGRNLCNPLALPSWWDFSALAPHIFAPLHPGSKAVGCHLQMPRVTE
jgi:hypothetical protein